MADSATWSAPAISGRQVLRQGRRVAGAVGAQIGTAVSSLRSQSCMQRPLSAALQAARAAVGRPEGLRYMRPALSQLACLRRLKPEAPVHNAAPPSAGLAATAASRHRWLTIEPHTAVNREASDGPAHFRFPAAILSWGADRRRCCTRDRRSSATRLKALLARRRSRNPPDWGSSDPGCGRCRRRATGGFNTGRPDDRDDRGRARRRGCGVRSSGRSDPADGPSTSCRWRRRRAARQRAGDDGDPSAEGGNRTRSLYVVSCWRWLALGLVLGTSRIRRHSVLSGRERPSRRPTSTV